MTENKRKHIKLGTIFRFCWNYWREYKPSLFGALTLIILSTLADIVIPIFSGNMIDALIDERIAESARTKTAFIALGGFIGFALLHHVLRIMGYHIWATMQCKILGRIVHDALYKVQRFSTDWHANSFAGATVRKVTRGKWAFDQGADTLYFGLLPAALVLVGIAVMQAYSWPLMGLAFAIGAVIYIVLSGVLANFYNAPAHREFNEQDSKLGGVLADSVTCNAVVKAFGSENREDAIVRHQSGIWYKLLTKTWKRGINTDSLQTSVHLILMACVLGLAIWRWAEGLATPGSVVFVMTSYMIMSGYMRNVGQQIRHLQKAVNELEDVVDFCNADLDVDDGHDAKDLRVDGGRIVFDNVTFRYANQKAATYENFSVDIKPGEKIGLVGHSGSGKSTFVKLIQRLYDVDAGEVLIDNQNVSKVTQQSLRQAIAMVQQEPILFHRSLAENIAYGRPDASMEEIEDAARQAHAYEFIEELPEGYKTMVGERGVKLSGGERQRVAIARAILADKPILILDEATSSLDSISEALIQDGIENLMEGRTTIMIAHRLSTIQAVDRILVFDRGQIVEEGTHRELLEIEDGYYRHLFDRQAMGLVGDLDQIAAE